MARERMVTRTVDLTIAEVMAVDTETAEVNIIRCELGGGFADKTAILKYAKRLYDTDTFKCVAVNNISTKEVLYGMTESEFIKLAKVLPPRTGNKD